MKKYFLLLFLINTIYSALLFKINPSEEQCFYEELFSETSIILKWKIFTHSKENVTSILPTISIIVSFENSGNVVYESKLISKKSKATFTVNDDGLYKICVKRRKYNGRDAPKEQVYGNLKITSINTDDINLADAVSYEDLGIFYNKTESIKELTEGILNYQNNQMEMENASSQETIYYTKWYRYITLTQVVLTLIVGLTQLNNFRRFLKSQHVIN